MSYGILLATVAGEVWVSPDSIPLALLTKRSVTVTNPQANTTISQGYDASKPIIPFVHCTASGAMWMDTTSGVCNVTITKAPAGTVMTVYYFTIFAQTPPAWGLAIWDANGTCILTNETRTLADMAIVGGPGTAGDNGINTNALLSGKWGCVPQYLGIATGVINDPLPRPWLSNIRAIAYPEGGNTRIIVNSDAGNSSGVSNVQFTNGHGNVIVARVGDYD